MYCPLCATALRSVDRQGTQIDHCPQCGGLWLDRGELDRIVQAEAIRALQAGYQQILAARRSREYDDCHEDRHFVEPLTLSNVA